MDARRSLAPQEVPQDFAALLRGLHDMEDPLLNVLLAGARTHGWRTPSLARALGMNDAAVSKRIERARRWAREAQATDEGYARVAEQAATVVIPEAPKVPAMINGKRLPADQLEQLRAMRLVAAKVNGAVKAGDPRRVTSEKFSAELDRLINQEDYSPYYLAKELGLTHRAITSRLERHHFREPCPSVAGTPSGEYFGRKIGDPGVGAPRLPRAERDELRRLWRFSTEPVWTVDRGGVAAALGAGQVGQLEQRLRAAVHGHLDDGYTLANLAQAMKLRSGQLQAFLDDALETAGV